MRRVEMTGSLPLLGNMDVHWSQTIYTDFPSIPHHPKNGERCNDTAKRKTTTRYNIRVTFVLHGISRNMAALEATSEERGARKHGVSHLISGTVG